MKQKISEVQPTKLWVIKKKHVKRDTENKYKKSL